MLLHDLSILQGKTFKKHVRWGFSPYVYKPITSIQKSSPCRIVVPGHDIPDGWPVAVVGVLGMKELNASGNPPKDKDYVEATVVDDDTIEINSLSSELFNPYTSGGAIVYKTPVDLTGYTARMMVKNKVGGTMLLSLTTENNGIVVDVARHVITLQLSATDTEAVTWKKGVYDLELVAPDSTVTVLLSGLVLVTREVTV